MSEKFTKKYILLLVFYLNIEKKVLIKIRQTIQKY